MTAAKIWNFLKSPFSKSFIIAYIFSFFSLWAVPLISKAVSCFLDHLDEFENLSQEETSKFLFELLKNNLNAVDMTTAIVGILLSALLLGTYNFLLTHKTVAEEKDIYDVSCLSLNLSEILGAIPKYIGYSLVFLLGMLLPFLGTVALVLISLFFPKVVTVLVGFLSFFLFFFLLYKAICYLYTASLIFYKDFQLSAFFNKAEVKQFFVQHKQKIFVSFLLSYVLGQVIYFFYSSVCLSIIQEVFVASVVLHVFDLSAPIVIALGLSLFNFIFTYLMILKAIVFGKIILWIEKTTRPAR